MIAVDNIVETQKKFNEALAELEEARGPDHESKKAFLKLTKQQAAGFLQYGTHSNHDHLLFSAAACTDVNQGSSDFFVELAAEKLSTERIAELTIQWYIVFSKLKIGGYYARRLPEFFIKGLPEATAREIMLTVIREAPDDSDLYIEAASRFIHNFRSTVAIQELRRLWSSISPQRREAIAIALQTDFQRYERDPREVVIIENRPSKLQLVVGESEFPTLALSRSRWIDRQLPFMRGAVWEATASSMRQFTYESELLGGEREQVGALLQILMTIFRERLHGSGSSPQGRTNYMDIKRYVFSTKEEKRWGPDFALLFTYTEAGKLTMRRYAIFQAKLVFGNSIRVTLQQLADVLKTSWHSSFYVFWGTRSSPQCVPASLLNLLIQAETVDDKGAAKSRNVQTSRLSVYSDHFADLIADRFVTGELGDPLPLESGVDSSEIAVRIQELVGPLRYGVIDFSVAVGGDRVSDRAEIQVGTEDIVL